MSLFKLLTLPLRIVNAPIRAVENLVGVKTESGRLISKPLDALADEVDEAVEKVTEDDK